RSRSRSRSPSRSRSGSRSSSWTPAPEDLPPITSRLSWTNSLRRRTRIRGVLSVHSSRPPGPCLGPGAAGRIVVEGDTPVAPGVQHRLDDAPRLDRHVVAHRQGLLVLQHAAEDLPVLEQITGTERGVEGDGGDGGRIARTVDVEVESQAVVSDAETQPVVGDIADEPVRHVLGILEPVGDVLQGRADRLARADTEGHTG